MQAAHDYEQLCRSLARLSEREQSRRGSLTASAPAEASDPSIPRLSVHIHPFASTLSKSHRASLLSVVSLDQVQDITALSLPLYSCEIYNSAQYSFSPHMGGKRKGRVRPKSQMFSWGAERSLVTRVTARLWKQSSKEIEISMPYEVTHNTHIGMDPDTGKMRIWGDETPETVVAKKVGWMG